MIKPPENLPLQLIERTLARSAGQLKEGIASLDPPVLDAAGPGGGFIDHLGVLDLFVLTTAAAKHGDQISALHVDDAVATLGVSFEAISKSGMVEERDAAAKSLGDIYMAVALAAAGGNQG